MTENIKRLATWHEKHLEDSSLGARVADRISRLMGSWWFISFQTLFILTWVSLNTLAYFKHWDIFPFVLLNLVFSTQATYGVPIIIMAQNRQAERDRIQATDNYQTNIIAKKEIETLQTHLTRLEVEKLNKIIELLEKIS